MTGFVRNGRYTVQCDGLRIKFVLRDVQKLQQPALPLIKCEGTFTRTCTTGTKWVTEVSLKARYQFDSDRLQAIGSALNIAFNRLTAGNPMTAPNGVVVAYAGKIREHLYEPIVEIMFSARSNPPTGTLVTVSPGMVERKLPQSDKLKYPGNRNGKWHCCRFCIHQPGSDSPNGLWHRSGQLGGYRPRFDRH